MDILLLNQAFYPDVAATAQYASDLAAELVDCGHQVTVVTSRRSYTSPKNKFLREENWRGVQILRCWSSRFGKTAKWKRALDFATIFASATMRLAFTGRFDAVLALTSPPLISALGAATARLKKARFIYWVMDLNPDEAIAAGWLPADSFPVKMLEVLSDFSLRRANRVVALDRFMAERLARKGVPHEKIIVIPPWPQEDAIICDPDGAASFRRRHGIQDKFLVMYSGNHSPCHPLDTLLEASLLLREHPRVAFCFIGGGSELTRVVDWIQQHALPNVLCLPYQPFSELSASLSAADLHVVVMGDAFVGIVHPCKVYNIKRVGVPFLYIGPAAGPIPELAPVASFRHGDAAGIVNFVTSAAERGIPYIKPRAEEFTRGALIAKLVAAIEGQLKTPMAVSVSE